MGINRTSSVFLLAMGAAALSADFHLPFPISIDVTAAADTFRSIPEGSWINNDGAYIGFNVGLPIPYLECEGFGAQVGASWGAYDWSGRESSPFGNPRAIQQQVFVTGGLFWKTTCCSGINMGVVYDWMVNKYFSAFGLQANMAQVRYKAGFLWDCSDEFGAWGANHVFTAHRTSGRLPVEFQAVNQINLFWQHNFENCGYTMLWGGVPYGNGLLFHGGRPGQFILGGRFGAPLSSCLSVEGHASYMAPRSKAGGEESQNYAYNVSVGITYSFGGSGLCDDCGVRPYLPLADNSQFIVDTNRNY